MAQVTNKFVPNLSEDDFGKKIDRCLTDSLVKASKFLAIFANYIINHQTNSCSLNLTNGSLVFF